MYEDFRSSIRQLKEENKELKSKLKGYTKNGAGKDQAPLAMTTFSPAKENLTSSQFNNNMNE